MLSIILVAVTFSSPKLGLAGASAVLISNFLAYYSGFRISQIHSGAADATMFPVLQDDDGAASLSDDDRSAIAAAYPGPGFASAFGTITGTVVRGSNISQPIPGALVTAWRLDPLNAPIGVSASDYSDESGAYALRGLAAGNYAVRIEPLDGSVAGLVPGAINDRVRSIADQRR